MERKILSVAQSDVVYLAARALQAAAVMQEVHDEEFCPAYDSLYAAIRFTVANVAGEVIADRFMEEIVDNPGECTDPAAILEAAYDAQAAADTFGVAS